MEDQNANSYLVDGEFLLCIMYQSTYKCIVCFFRKENQRASLDAISGVLWGDRFEALKFGGFMGYQSPFLS